MPSSGRRYFVSKLVSQSSPVSFLGEPPLPKSPAFNKPQLRVARSAFGTPFALEGGSEGKTNAENFHEPRDSPGNTEGRGQSSRPLGGRVGKDMARLVGFEQATNIAARSPRSHLCRLKRSSNSSRNCQVDRREGFRRLALNAIFCQSSQARHSAGTDRGEIACRTQANRRRLPLATTALSSKMDFSAT